MRRNSSEGVRNLNHKNNFRDLLELQIVSVLIGSALHFVAGSLGYGAKAMMYGRTDSMPSRKSAEEGKAERCDIQPGSFCYLR